MIKFPIFSYTHIVIGRKHADAPYKDGTAIWGDFDAQEIFENLGGDLQIKPVRVGFASFYESLGRVDLMENHSEEKPVFIFGKAVRATKAQRRTARVGHPTRAVFVFGLAVERDRDASPDK
jgi:sulfate adenylyltransferase